MVNSKPLRYLKWIIQIIILYAIVNIIYGVMPLSVKIFFHFEKKDQIDTTYITKKIPTDYLRILKLPKNCCTDSAVLLKKTVMSKFRNSISLFIYKKQYCIQIYKLTDHFNSSLINGIVEQASSSTVSYNQYYS